MQIQDFCHNWQANNGKKGTAKEKRFLDGQQEAPKTLEHPEAASFGEQLQLLPHLRCRPGGEQPEPPPTVKNR